MLAQLFLQSISGTGRVCYATANLPPGESGFVYFGGTGMPYEGLSL